MSKQGWFSRNRHLYPPDWTDIANAVKTAAGWHCVACGAPHGKSPHVLTVDHLNHDVENKDAVLLALCQQCHLMRQGLRPRPQTAEEAIQRIRERRFYRSLPVVVQASGRNCPSCGGDTAQQHPDGTEDCKGRWQTIVVLH